ncbi:MAG TPA: DUF2442 domain-containing protein [Pyrinomonadaceae bacterium]|nr:DUF2442 domain-containing protein [Pyrinomonadaceae bacterium]
MIKPTRVQALPEYRIYLEFSDGAKGEVDLSDLASNGVFQAWNDDDFFEKVHLGDHHEIKWKDEIELCADSLYLKLTGKSPEELFPKLRREASALQQGTSNDST